jgi:hypothetical protein
MTTYAIPKLSLEARLSERLKEWGMPLSTFYQLMRTRTRVKLTYPRFHGALSGREAALSNEVAEAIQPFILELDALTAAVRPLALDLSNGPVVNYWLDLVASGKLEIKVVAHG